MPNHKKVFITVSLLGLLVLAFFLGPEIFPDGKVGQKTETRSSSVGGQVVIPLGITIAENQGLTLAKVMDVSNISIIGPRGNSVSNAVSVSLDEQSDGEYGLVVKPKDSQQFRPGKYKIAADLETAVGKRHIEQDFLWGVLAINPNKSIYLSHETAQLAMAVLDEQGLMVCDAEVILEIRNPEAQVQILSTANGKIVVNDACQQKKKTNQADYEAEYEVKGPGIYQMKLTAKTVKGEYSIEDYFAVAESVPFAVERVAATRVFPQETYDVLVRITAQADFVGSISETVPGTFKIQPLAGREFTRLRIGRAEQEYAWDVAVKAGDVFEIGYSFDAPNISPQFYLLGPLEFIDESGVAVFREARSWQLANDVDLESEDFESDQTTPFGSWTADGGSCTWVANQDATGSNNTGPGGSNSAGTGYDHTLGTTSGWYLYVEASGNVCQAGDLEAVLTYTGSDIDGSSYSLSLSFWYHMWGSNMGDLAVDVSNNGGGSWDSDVELLSAAQQSAGDDPYLEGTVDLSSYTGSDVVVRFRYDNVSGFAADAAIDDIVISGTQDNASPSINSVIDTPDPVGSNRTVSFFVNWTDENEGEKVKAKVCKTNSLSGQNCDGGFWATSTAFSASNPRKVKYNLVEDDAGQTRSYYAFVCDDGGLCSIGSTGTFTVSGVQLIPNVKVKGSVNVR